MELSQSILPMALFALATSATPGPVNLISSMSGARFGAVRALPYVLGATVSFDLILILIGIGVNSLLKVVEQYSLVLMLIGSAYMLYLAIRIAADSGDLSIKKAEKPCPGFISGMITQATNPKAWFVSLSAVTIYLAPYPHYSWRMALFATLFFFICFASLALWAYMGERVARFTGNLALFNRCMAALLAASVIWILLEQLVFA